MTMHIPEYIDEMVDPNDPLAILLAREGSNDEAYITARQYLSEQRQIIERARIDDNAEIARDGEWIKRTRRLSSKVIVKRSKQ